MRRTLAEMITELRKAYPAGTVSVWAEPLPTTGYWVAIAGGVTVDRDLMSDDHIEDVVSRFPDFDHFGIWESDGYVHVDAVIHTLDLEYAVAVGRLHEQEAIHDIQHGVDVALLP